MDTWNETEDQNENPVTLSMISNETVFNMSLLGPQRDSFYIIIPMTIIYAVIFLTGVIGNVSTCIVIARNKSMHTATNYYLFSLAISDLLLLITGLPQEMYSIWSRYPYIFGEVFCVLRGLASETSANATVLTITAFTVERYVAICHPFLSHTMSKLSRVVKLIFIIWLVAFCFAVPQALQFGIVYIGTVQCLVKKIIIKHSFELSTFLFFVAPMTLITVLYTLIGWRLRTSNMMKRNSSRRSCRHQHGQSSRRVLKMLVAVVVAFFICWAPFHAQRLIAIYGKYMQDEPPYKLKLYEIITYVSGILYYMSTTVNPVLYHIMSNKFREAFKETFSRCCWGKWYQWGKRSNGSRRLSERRSYYSVLSRSGAARGVGGRNAATQESTDSGVSITHRHSQDSMCLHPAPCTHTSRHGPFMLNDTQNQGSANESPNEKRVSEQFKVDIHEVAMKILNSHPCDSPMKQRRSKLRQFFELFRLSNKTPDDKKLSPNVSPISENCGRGSIANKVNVKLHKSSYDVSNSSLKDIDNSALKEEFTIYMNEIQRREKD